MQSRTFSTFRKGVLFSFQIEGTADKGLGLGNLEELGDILCNIYYCSSAKHLSSLFRKSGLSCMVGLVYKQGFIAKHFVGARERERGQEAGRERDKTPFSSSSKLDITAEKALWDQETPHTCSAKSWCCDSYI